MFKFIAMPIVLIGLVAGATTAQSNTIQLENKVFHGLPISTFGNNMIFQTTAGLEVVPVGDTTLSVENGTYVFTMNGLAEDTRVDGYLTTPVTVYTLSGSGNHSALWQTVFGMVTGGSTDGGSTLSAPPPQELTSSWKSKDGATHTVRTPRKPREKPAKHAARHKAAVDALKAVFPPKPVPVKVPVKKPGGGE